MTQPPSTAAEYEQQQRDEWTRYVAKVPVDYYGVRAYNVGDPVPASAVGDDPSAGQWVSPDYVTEQGDAFAGSGTVVPPEPPTIDPTAVAAPPASSPVAPDAAGADTVTSSEG
jgi:hypothetical protein